MPRLAFPDDALLEERLRGSKSPRRGDVVAAGDLGNGVCGRIFDAVGRDLDAVEIAQVPDNLAGAHAAGVHRDDLVIEPREAALVLGDQLRAAAGLAVARHRELDLAGIRDDGRLAITISSMAAMSMPPSRMSECNLVVLASGLPCYSTERSARYDRPGTPRPRP